MDTVEAPPKARSSQVRVVEDRRHGDPAGRLIVLVPDVADAALLAGRIQRVAGPWKQDVVLFGMVSKSSSESELRRRITLLAAFLEQAGTRAEIQMVQDIHCMHALQGTVGEKDRLAYCVAEGPTAFGERWLERLADQFLRPVYAFMDAKSSSQTKPTPSRLASSIGSVIVIVGFTWLQIELSRGGAGAANTAWLMLSVGAEFGLIWLLNAFMG